MQRQSAQSLRGITVIDLTQIVSGSLTTMLLADFGAEVIKIEPLGGETYRHAGYPLKGDGGETNLNILRFTRGKKSVEINLKSREGAQIFEDLVKQADVLVENFRPGVLARLGFPADRLEEINPDLVYASVSGFGHDDVLPSPYRDLPAYAILSEAMAGLTHLAGDAAGPPVWMGFAMADIFAGTLAFAGILIALRDRETQGTGTRVDIAMFDSSLLMNDLAMAYRSIVGETMGRGQYVLQSPWGPFQASDGYVIIAVLNPREWQALCSVIDRPDLAEDPGLATGIARSQAHDSVVRPAIELWTQQRSRSEAIDLLNRGGVPAAPVNTSDDLIRNPQVEARQMLQDVRTSELGTVRVVGNPIKVASSLVGGDLAQFASLGSDTREVLERRIGLSTQEITDLRERGVIGGD